MIQPTPVRRITILVLLLTLFFIPVNDTLRASSNFDHVATFPDGKVNTDYLNVRTGPGTGYGVVGNAALAEPIYISSQSSDCLWLEVAFLNGTRGWVYGPLVELYRPCREFAISSLSAQPDAPTEYHNAPTYYASPVPYQAPPTPVYHQPVHQQPEYQQPVYVQETYRQPVHVQETYQQPVHVQETYQQPAYQAPASSYAPQHVDPRNRYVNLGGPLSSELAGLHEFSWQANFPLGYGEAFELVFWRTGQDPMIHGFSPLEATGATTVLVDLDESIRRIPQLQNGFDYVWSVLLVQTYPYQRLALLSPGHQFRLEQLFRDRSSSSDSGSSNGGGDDNNGDNNGGGNPPVEQPTQSPPVVQPTQGPLSTPFVVGTFTPTNTPTRIPTRTATPEPASEATPEQRRTIFPTNTPAPANTVAPTDVPEPTNTPVPPPTITPIPTSAP